MLEPKEVLRNQKLLTDNNGSKEHSNRIMLIENKIYENLDYDNLMQTFSETNTRLIQLVEPHKF